MPITLDGDIITVEFQDGDPKGDSWDDPYTLDDIIVASDDGSWDPAVTKQCNQIHIPYRLYILGIDTFFEDQNLQICQAYFGSTYALYITSNFRSRGNSKGTQWTYIGTIKRNFLYIYSDGEVLVENTFFGFGRFTIVKGTFINVVFQSVHYTIVYADTIFNYVTLCNCTYGLLPYGSASLSNINLIDNIYAFRISHSFDISNLKLSGNTYTYYILRNGSGCIVNIIDSQVSTDLPYVINETFTGDTTVNYISTFKINIEDGNGGTAKLYDQYDNLVFEEVLSGELQKSVIYFKHYVETDGSLVADEKTTYELFKLIISKANYVELTIPNIDIEPGEETHITGKLVKPTYYHQDIKGTVKESEVSGKVTIEDEVTGTIEDTKVTGTVEVVKVTGKVTLEDEVSGNIK